MEPNEGFPLVVGRSVVLAGAAVVLASALMPWFWSERDAVGRTEMGLQGEESLFAVAAALIAGVLQAVAFVRKKRSIVMSLLVLVGAVASVILASVYIAHNGPPLYVAGRFIPIGIGTGAYVGVSGAALMVLGALMEITAVAMLRFFTFLALVSVFVGAGVAVARVTLMPQRDRFVEAERECSTQRECAYLNFKGKDATDELLRRQRELNQTRYTLGMFVLPFSGLALLLSIVALVRREPKRLAVVCAMLLAVATPIAMAFAEELIS